jgi:L-threonylcarbamoyladenylate synthase
VKTIPIYQANPVEVAKILEKGGLIIYPTETLYGAGVDATNKEAVIKLCNYKKRPFGKPLSIAVDGQKMAESFVELNSTAVNLYKRFLPGPMTIVSRVKVKKLAPGVASELGTVGVRISSYDLVTKVVKALGKPITATSANASYKKRPYSVADVLENLSEKQKALIDLIIDAGELPHNEPSTVVDTTLEDLRILRQGDILLETENQILSRSEENTQNIGKELWQKYEKYSGQRAIVFALEGPMGAGKTQFVKGLARAMGIEEEIVSPTFNLELDYEKLIHIDAWRMLNGQELEELGFKGLINDRSVIAIEWADRVADTIRKYDEEAVVVWVKINYPSTGSGQVKDNERLIGWGML